MSDAEHWDQRYATGNIPWETGQPSSELVRVVTEQRITPCRAIELGCGTGASAVWLAQRGFDVTGVDISPRALNRARRRAAQEAVAVTFLEADVLQPPAGLVGPFDLFFDRGCYHVVRRISNALYVATLLKLTVPGSVGLVLAGNAREPLQPGPPVVTEEEVRTELGKDFTILWLREFRFNQSEGSDVRPLGWSCGLRR